MEGFVRISEITIENFKNVEYGILSFENNRKEYQASVLGLYGQNGSGKTALIDALGLLKYVLCGSSVPEFFCDYINVDSAEASFSYIFKVFDGSETYNLNYQFSIRCIKDDTGQNINSSIEGKRRIQVIKELLKCPILSEKQIKSGKLIDTQSDEIFVPVSKRILLIGKEKEILNDLEIAKRMASSSSRAFVFSNELLSAIRNNAKTNREREFVFYYKLIEKLVNYGNFELFVINTVNSGLISLNAQPLSFKYKTEQMGALGQMAFPLDGPFAIPEEESVLVNRIIGSMNVVLEQMIPGMVIKVKNLGKYVMDDGRSGFRIQLISDRKGREIPLNNESEGIKKIISILQLLIVVFNESSITVAIDELDSGVFEYLLGELLRIISEKGKGQLIFTSHNLRPLETIDKGFVAFTTTNPKNRYTRITGVKETNNLRDYYYRDIILQENHENLYDQTLNAEIALAFKLAGGIDAE